MSDNQQLFGTRELVGVIEDIRGNLAPSFLLNLAFGDFDPIYSDKEKILLDDIFPDRRVAAFYAPQKITNPTLRKGFEVREIQPAYVKDKGILTPEDLKKRLPGERLDGQFSPQDRMMSHMGIDLGLQIQRHRRRLELMAVEALTTGGLIIDGDNVERRVLDFGRDANLQSVLTGVIRWGETGVSPHTDLKAMKANVEKKGGGRVTDIVMDHSAYELWAADPLVEKLINQDINQDAVANLGFTDASPNVPVIQARFNGCNIWTYQDEYELPDGTTTDLVPEYTVIFLSRGTYAGRQCFGLIQDMDYVAEGSFSTDIYAKSRVIWEPSSAETLTQSAPLLFPARVNGSGCMTVR